LNLDYTSVSDKGLPKLQALTSLTRLSLDSASITDEGAAALASMKGLKYLNLYHTLVSDKGYQMLKAALPGCEIVFDRESSLPTRRRS
jgi:Leucine-rich repeat (LRR) protein